MTFFLSQGWNGQFLSSKTCLYCNNTTLEHFPNQVDNHWLKNLWFQKEQPLLLSKTFVNMIQGFQGLQCSAKLPLPKWMGHSINIFWTRVKNRKACSEFLNNATVLMPTVNKQQLWFSLEFGNTSVSEFWREVYTIIWCHEQTSS